MNPLTAPITRTAKPTLITTGDLFVETGSVHRLIQTKELRAGHDGVRVGVRCIANRAPGPGDLISPFQSTTGVPTNDQTAVGLSRVGQRGCGVRVPRRNENQKAGQSDYVGHPLLIHLALH